MGEQLFEKDCYIPNVSTCKKLTPVRLSLDPKDRGALIPVHKSMFNSSKHYSVDIAFPVFHGRIGEDGSIQGAFETAGVPYAGMRPMASNLFMDKAATKLILKSINVPHLDCYVIRKPVDGHLLKSREIASIQRAVKFPVCIKPAHMGSSIGVSRISSIEELIAVLPRIFSYDSKVILEPFVGNAYELNIAVRNTSGGVVTSAIEKPLRSTDLLDFKQKYLSENGKGGGKTASSQGMISLTREINPLIDSDVEQRIRDWACQVFEVVDGTGVPRIDFMVDTQTDTVLLNEVNPTPGSLAFFLWEQASTPTTFTQLVDDLLTEATRVFDGSSTHEDPVPEEARIFKRP